MTSNPFKPFTVRAYAKLNLALDIVGRRGDGYHLLRMVNQSVDLCDRLSFTPSEVLWVECDDESLPNGKENLVYRAAERFYEAVPAAPRALVRLQKTIPHEAGLGGGSADAAAALHALNRLCGKPLSTADLCALGEQVGADVPFCVLGGTALVSGIGEELLSLPPMPDCFVVLCKPPLGVETKAAFAMADRMPPAGARRSAAAEAAIREGDLVRLGAAVGNHFEEVLGLPEIRSLRESFLSAGALGASMSGSGSAVFGLFPEETAARACAQTLRAQYASVFVCRPVQTVQE